MQVYPARTQQAASHPGHCFCTAPCYQQHPNMGHTLCMAYMSLLLFLIFFFLFLFSFLFFLFLFFYSSKRSFQPSVTFTIYLGKGAGKTTTCQKNKKRSVSKGLSFSKCHFVQSNRHSFFPAFIQTPQTCGLLNISSKIPINLNKTLMGHTSFWIMSNANSMQTPYKQKQFINFAGRHIFHTLLVENKVYF